MGMAPVSPDRHSSGRSPLRRLSQGKISLGGKLRSIFTGRAADGNAIAEMEDVLIGADFGIEFTEGILEDLRNRPVKGGDIASSVREILRERMVTAAPRLDPDNLNVMLLFGVNGTGKTTSIGKLAWYYKQANAHVLVAAADTYRDAAVEQLTVWCERAGVPIIKQHQGADPGAVVYDACDAAVSKGVQVLLVDTAGRLHNREQLMRELGKLSRILDKKLPAALKMRILVIDATTGQNGLSQASLFQEQIGVDGILLAKLDSSAKGGTACAISGALSIPILFAGIGEGIEDIIPFDVDEYLDALLASR